VGQDLELEGGGSSDQDQVGGSLCEALVPCPEAAGLWPSSHVGTLVLSSADQT
jgi:hypothetical protein